MTYTHNICYKNQPFSQRLFLQGEKRWETGCTKFFFKVFMFIDVSKGFHLLIKSVSPIYIIFYMVLPLMANAFSAPDFDTALNLAYLFSKVTQKQPFADVPQNRCS